ncbi:MAG TPA: sterol desaturase family protein [Cyclobacteriaceae bacterium]|nr:sterol desaturase family protein [Cyclobacteriaceae bacterium]
MSGYLTGKSLFTILVIILMRYLILASIAFFVFYVIKRKSWLFRKIQQRFPIRKDYYREFSYSLLTAVIFAVIGYLVYLTPFVRLTKVYYKIADFGIAYFVVSVFLMIIVHDTYFYWTHRMMHHRSIYRWVHRVHHLSTNPSPWAAMAFHPYEAIIEACVIVIIPFIFPVHPLAIGLFLLIMMIYNVYGHLGFELYPKGFSKSVIGRWVNTSINHNLHHESINGNYGLYFLFWDRLTGTINPMYDQRFDEVKSRVSNPKN